MILKSRRSLSAVAVGALLSAPILVAPSAQAADPVDITLVDINDFHGRIDTNTTKFATTLEQIRQSAGEANTLFLSVGDNIGASPFASATQQDAPTIDVLNALDLDVSAVGNHEFDRGFADLTGRVADRADFSYLGANVRLKSDGSAALPASETFTVGGLKLAVIGAVTQETPTLVTPTGISTLTFTDPVDAVNDEVDRLEALPEADRPDVIVAAYHEGAGAGTPDGSSLAQELAHGGAFADIVNNTDASVDAIFTGHTHKTYAWDAQIPGQSGTRPVIQTGSYGENIGKVTLSVDPDTGAVASSTVANVPRVDTANESLPRVAAVKKVVDDALAHATAIGNEKVGDITGDITRAFSGGSYVDGKYTGGTTDDRASESTLGNLVPDAMLAQSKATNAPADLAINNPGGLRNSELFYAGNTTTGGPNNTDGVVTFAEANSILPFTNNLYTVTLTGASLKKVFEQQWQRNADGSVPSRPYLQLGVSDNVRYTYDATRPEGQRVTSLWIDDQPVAPAKSYRVIAPSFLATGGDNFSALTEGSWVDTGVVDYEGWIEYLGANSPVSPDFGRRAVAVTGLADSYEAGQTVTFSLPKLNLTSLGSPANTSVAATLEYGDGQTLDLGTQVVTNGASGQFSFAVPAGAIGGGTIRAVAAPSGTVATIPLAVEKAASTVRATAPTKVAKGETFDVSVDVTAAAGVDVAGEVVVRNGDSPVGTATVVDGSATVKVAADDLRLGLRTLTVAFRGSDSVAASQDTVTVDVVRGETTFTAAGSSTQYGTAPRITLTAAPGTTGIVYVANQLGMTVGTAFLSDGKGTFRFGGTALKPGTYRYGLFFNGSSSYEPADATATVTVAKADVKLRAAAAKKITVGKRATLTARVTATGFKPGGTVIVKRGSKVVGKATVKNGVARVKLAKLKRGKTTLTVHYKGGSVAKDAKTSVKTTVVKKK
ncbi:5'-nucleotidase C-terminal domain-containing protein [Aeromicrobium duanguangcaii]|uniref:5'-nucleotidase C-terminal domain-containing protein n=1 Tax=Aeromicrobium duanguangcaii TaxID=2968086 RepID=A0ABY5KD53_9ACTN|nr:5'-nucleotidase C-terminal domain-containing protein [Aeromicrobium duanguangcaii]MCD9155091.1 5'-nucleotidase C-terminal domain-containing protein [Aeromicrobium duanguangcaii]UUI68255.1 5'-nucleotidase C-terminal domain-containing protein [Aeromicrobium duanguangcaii]